MSICLILLLAVTLLGCKVSSFQEDYLSISSSTAVKGIFAVLIFYSHISGYLVLEDTVWNSCFKQILDFFGQLMVVMFLFYSGYGIMESYKHKAKYLETFIVKRFIRTLLHFVIAVALFICVQTSLGNVFSWKQYLFCWLGWESVGNSNWFVFDILCLYIISFVGLLLANFTSSYSKKNNLLLAGVVISLLSVIFWLVLRNVKDSWWYDTIAVFPLGMWVSIFKDYVDNFLSKKHFSFFLVAITMIVFLADRYFVGIDHHGLCACLFSIFFVALTSKVKFDNIVLQWLGRNAFYIYILQRIPMIIFANFNLNNNVALFVILVSAVTLVLAEIFSILTKRMDAILFE